MVLPELVMDVAYDFVGDPSELHLASGGVLTGHADFIDAWEPAALDALVADCLGSGRRSVGSPPFGRAARAVIDPPRAARYRPAMASTGSDVREARPYLDDVRPVPLGAVDEFRAKGHTVLRGLARPDEVERFRPAIEATAARLTIETRPIEERDTYGQAFLQTGNLWREDALDRAASSSPAGSRPRPPSCWESTASGSTTTRR